MHVRCAWLTQQHVPVGLVGDGVHMGWDFVALLATIQLNDLLGVDGVEAVRVNHHTEQARVGLEWGKKGLYIW